MSTSTSPATGTITVRLPVALIEKLDALAAATERSRNYWVHEAVKEVIERELWQVREIEEAIAEDDADPDRGIPSDELWSDFLARGLISQEAIDRAETEFSADEFKRTQAQA